jgi:hypothetical protein
MASDVCDLSKMLAQAARFYGPSIDFSQVTVRRSRVALGRRPWTANNTIRLADRPQAGSGGGCSGPALATLVHELAHVWQYQNGNLQLLRGVVEQMNYQLGRDPYDYGGAAGVRAAVKAGSALISFSNESQAQILEDYWSALNVPGATGYGRESFTPAYVDDLRTLVTGAGIGSRAPSGANRVETATGWVVNRVAGWLEPVVGAFGK